MSRIEKAMENAVRLRNSSRDNRTTVPIQQDGLNSHVPVFEIGRLLIDPASVNEHLICVTKPDSTAAEQYKILRARLIRAMEKDKMNSLLVTSAHSGEGKTVTAINLAIAMARSIDHTVLLIDTDLRKPAVHTYLGLRPKYGLSDCLRSKSQLSQALIKTGIGKLVVLPAGTPVDNSAELLASGKMKELIKEVKSRYSDRYVIYDSSPVLAASDVINISGSIDSVLFVIQAMRTSQKSVLQAISLIKGSRIIGSVFNNVPPFLATKAAPYHYGYVRPAPMTGKASVPAGTLSDWFSKLFRNQS